MLYFAGLFPALPLRLDVWLPILPALDREILQGKLLARNHWSLTFVGWIAIVIFCPRTINRSCSWAIRMAPTLRSIARCHFDWASSLPLAFVLYILLGDILYFSFFASSIKKVHNFCKFSIDLFFALKNLELASSIFGCLRLRSLIRILTRLLSKARGFMNEQLAHSVH